MIDLRSHTNQVKTKAKRLGFDDVGISDLKNISKDFENFYYTWLKNGRHGAMQYMEKNAKQRFYPELLLENAQTAIVVVAAYPNHKIKQTSRYKISNYALGKDYHFIIKSKLHKLLEYIQTIEPHCKGRAFTDSAPVPERYLAQKAGLGFIGKNSMLIHPELGSFIFIGELYIDGLMHYDKPLTGYSCGNCRLCIATCPNQAIVNPQVLNSNRCISYLTIEHKGAFEESLNLSGYIFGCDICQMVCPYNQDIRHNSWYDFEPQKQITGMSNDEWQTIGSSKFKRLFERTVLLRSGLKKIRRNIQEINNNKLPDKQNQ